MRGKSQFWPSPFGDPETQRTREGLHQPQDRFLSSPLPPYVLSILMHNLHYICMVASFWSEENNRIRVSYKIDED